MRTRIGALARLVIVPVLVCMMSALSSCQSPKPGTFDRWSSKDRTELLAAMNAHIELIKKTDPTSEDVVRLRSLIEQERVLYEKYHQEPPEWTLPKAFEEKEADDRCWPIAKSGKVCIGMSREQARTAWGKPRRINSTATESGTSEQWCYDNEYLYFDDGRLTSVHTSR